MEIFKTIRQIYEYYIVGSPDTSDIPEVRDWSHAVVGKFYNKNSSLNLEVDLYADEIRTR